MNSVRRSLGSVGMLLAVLLLSPALRAEDKPVPFCTVSVSSLTDLKNLADSLGVKQLPPFLTARGIGQQFPFIGADGMSTRQPVGLVFSAADGYDIGQGQGIVFVLPVKSNVATLDTFKQMGGVPVEGHDDSMVVDKKVTFRRTEGVVMFGTTSEAVTAVDPGDVTKLYAGTPVASRPVVRIRVDAAAVRDQKPDEFKRFMDTVKKQTKPAENPDEQLGQDLAYKMFASLNRLDLDVLQHGKDVELRFGIDPVKLPAAAGSFSRPGMPADAILRLDLGFPVLQQYPDANEFVTNLVRTSLKNDGKSLSANQEKQLSQFLKNAAELLAGGQALSVGVAPAGNSAVVYVVQQYDKPVDLPARMRAIAQQFTRVSSFMDKNGHSTADVQTYSDRGARVNRLRFLDGGAPQLFVDGVENGSTVYLAATVGSDAHHVAALANATERGSLKDSFAANLDLGGALRLLEQIPDSPVAGLSNQSQKQLHQALDGKQLRVTGVTKGTESFFTLRLPSQLVEEIVKQIPGQQDAGNQKDAGDQ